jgi:hypothetical protein
MEAGATTHIEPLTPDRCQYMIGDGKPCQQAPLSKNMPFCKDHKKAPSKKSPMTGWEPFYAPSFYNKTSVMKHNHNCFAYAFDINDPPDESSCIKNENGECNVGFHQPGYFAGFPKFRADGKKYCPELLARLLGDMPWLKLTTFDAKCEKGYSKIALVIDPHQDYHFYRQDSNGLWSHKPGGTAVTNRDSHGYLIYRPDLANRDSRTSEKDNDGLNYTIFCSYLAVPRNKRVQAQRGGKRGSSKRRSSRKRVNKTRRQRQRSH